MRKFSAVVPVDIITCEMVANIWDLQAMLLITQRSIPRAYIQERESVKKRKLQSQLKVKTFSLTVFLLGIEKKTTSPKWHHSCWKPRIPNLDLMPDLIAGSSSLRNVILIDQAEIFWSSTNKVISHVGPLHPPEEEEAICMIKHLSFPFPAKEDVLA